MGYPKSGKTEKAGAGGRAAESPGEPRRASGAPRAEDFQRSKESAQAQCPGTVGWAVSGGGDYGVPAPDLRSPAPAPASAVPGAPPPPGQEPELGAQSSVLWGPVRGARGPEPSDQLKRRRGWGWGRAGLGMAQPRPPANAGRPRRGSLPAGAGWQVRTRERMAWPKGSAGAAGSARLPLSPTGSAPARAGMRGSVMEGVLASGMTPGHGSHRAHPCPGVPGFGRFLPLSKKQ